MTNSQMQILVKLLSFNTPNPVFKSKFCFRSYIALTDHNHMQSSISDSFAWPAHAVQGDVVQETADFEEW